MSATTPPLTIPGSPFSGVRHRNLQRAGEPSLHLRLKRDDATLERVRDARELLTRAGALLDPGEEVLVNADRDADLVTPNAPTRRLTHAGSNPTVTFKTIDGFAGNDPAMPGRCLT